MLAVLGERRRHRHSERLLFDLDIDTEFAQYRMQLGVEVGDRDAVGKVERASATVVRANDQRVGDEVEVDLEGRVVVMQPPGRKAADVDIERSVPPVITRRRGREADLADDLAVEMQRVLRRAPVGEVQLRQRHRASASRRVAVS